MSPFQRRPKETPDQLFERVKADQYLAARQVGVRQEDALRSAAVKADVVVRHQFRDVLLTDIEYVPLVLPGVPPRGLTATLVTGHLVRSRQAEPPLTCPRCGQPVDLFIRANAIETGHTDWVVASAPDLEADPTRGRWLVDRPTRKSDLIVHRCA